jgi:type I restriction enzyme S subunit
VIEENELPSGWAWTTLGNIGEWSGGGTPNKSNEMFWMKGTIPWVSPKDMKTLEILDTEDHISDIAIAETNLKVCPIGAILIVVRSGILQRTLPVAIAKVPITMNQDMKGIYPVAGINTKYILYYLIYSELQILAQCSKYGTTVASIESERLKNHKIPIAPLSEQLHIVEAIEQQFSRLDTGIASLRSAQKKLKLYRASVLKAAVEGELTAEWRAANPPTEPASVLLERILKERRERWEEEQRAKGRDPKKVRYPDPAVPSNESEIQLLPEGWCQVTLGQVTWSVKDGPHYSPQYVSEGVPFITGGNVRPTGIDFANAKYISPELHAELSKRCKPEKGDVLYTKGGTTGIARVNTYDIDFNVWVHVAVLKVVPSVLPFYIQHALNSPSCYAQAQKYTHGVGNQDLGLTRMVNITFALPPLAEQQQILSLIEEHMSTIDELEATIEKAFKRAELQRQSILHQAFTGKLVPQDPNDEPASVLLERIQQERDQNSKKVKANSHGAARKRTVKKEEPVRVQEAQVEPIDTRSLVQQGLW